LLQALAAARDAVATREGVVQATLELCDVVEADLMGRGVDPYEADQEESRG
jgi:hypothetical protein